VLASIVQRSGAYSVVAAAGFSYFLRFCRRPASRSPPQRWRRRPVISDNADSFTDVIAIPPNLISTTIWDVGLRKHYATPAA
jgi:hypothetical protein